MSSLGDLSEGEVSALLVVSAFGSIVTGILFAYSTVFLDKRRKLAIEHGDEKAALKIILPCYRPLYIGLTVIFFVMSVAQVLSLSNRNISTPSVIFILQFYSLCVLASLSVCPLLFTQKGVSKRGFIQATLLILPWYLVCIGILVLIYFQQDWFIIPSVIFLFFTFIPTFSLSVGILSRLIHSRIRLGSVSNRNAVEHFFVFSIIFSLLNLLNIIGPSNPTVLFPLLLTYVIVTCIWIILFPLVFHRSLLADTKFWRGLGKHNKGGIQGGESIDRSDMPRPNIDIQTTSTDLQDMMGTISDILLDFAYLEVNKRIGDGATSKVYSGTYFNRKVMTVAIKMSTPSDIDKEVLEQFIAEGRVSSKFINRNVVLFHGLCVRPPQIAFVTELCDGGNLKSSLVKNPHIWSDIKRLQACYDACVGVSVLHEKGYIHRDVKTENFFVINATNATNNFLDKTSTLMDKIRTSKPRTEDYNLLSQSLSSSSATKDFVIKLGDFGETKPHRTKESLNGERLPIGGTPEYQSPELIDVKKYHYYYSYAIDIYALGISFWEIWMMGSNVYHGQNSMEITQGVYENNLRPDVTVCLEKNAPTEFVELMTSAWHADPEQRPTAKELMNRLEGLILNYGKETYLGLSQA